MVREDWRHCWDDISQLLHQRFPHVETAAPLVVKGEALPTLKVRGGLEKTGGPVAGLRTQFPFMVAAGPEKGKRGADRCRIYVSVFSLDGTRTLKDLSSDVAERIAAGVKDAIERREKERRKRGGKAKRDLEP